jgi:predicted transcriptional regulator
MGVTSVRLSDDLQDRLEQTAGRLRRSKGWVISEALAEFLAREERHLQRLQRTRAALDQLDAGQVIDGDEVLNWISSWGDESEKPIPGS